MILSAPLPPWEGIGFYVWNLARQLTRCGHKIHLITRGTSRPTFHEEQDGITIWRPTFLPIYPFHVQLHGIYVNWLLSRLEGQLDLVHLHSPLVQLPKTRLPVLVTVHTPMKADTAAIPATSVLSWLVRLQAPISVMIESKLFNRANRLVSVSQSVANELEDYGIPEEQIHVLGNGADTEIFFPKGKALRDDHTPYFFTAGRLALRKGLEDLISAAVIIHKEAPDIQFWIAGEGPLRNHLLKLIYESGLEQSIILLGHIHDRNEMADLYRNAIAYIHPAHYEGLPTALLEAMACGTPPLATAVSGALDIIETGKNGYLVPTHNPSAMAKAALYLLREPEHRKNLGMAASQTINNRFSWEQISQAYLKEYEILIQRERA